MLQSVRVALWSLCLAAARPAAAPVDDALMEDAPADDAPTAAAAAAASLSPATPAPVGCPLPLLDIHIPRLWTLWTVGLGAVQQPLEQFAGRAPGGMQRYFKCMHFPFLSFETLFSCLFVLCFLSLWVNCRAIRNEWLKANGKKKSLTKLTCKIRLVADVSSLTLSI